MDTTKSQGLFSGPSWSQQAQSRVMILAFLLMSDPGQIHRMHVGFISIKGNLPFQDYPIQGCKWVESGRTMVYPNPNLAFIDPVPILICGYNCLRSRPLSPYLKESKFESECSESHMFCSRYGSKFLLKQVPYPLYSQPENLDTHIIGSILQP